MKSLVVNKSFYKGTPKRYCFSCKKTVGKTYQYGKCRDCILRYYQSPQVMDILNRINSRKGNV